MRAEVRTIARMDFEQFDLNLLRVLVAIHRTGSVTVAGQSLSLSQSATSSALGRLRQHLGDALFVRTPNGLAPTRLCERIAPEVAEVLQRIESTMSTQNGFDPQVSHYRWRVSLSDLGEMMFLPALASTIRRQAPHSQLANAAVPAERMTDALENREIDLAIGLLNPSQRGICSELLYRDRYVAMSSTIWTPTGETSGNQLSVKQLGQSAIAVASPSATFHGNLEKMLARLKLADRIAIRAQHFVALSDVATSTDMLTIVPLTYTKQPHLLDQVRVWELPPEASAGYELRQVWHDSTTRDPAHVWLREQVHSLFWRPEPFRPPTRRVRRTWQPTA